MKIISKNMIWAEIFIFVIIVCIFFILSGSESSKTAVIYSHSEVIKRIDDLYPDEVERTVVETENGYNKIAWYNGEIWVEESDCKKQTCVHFGKLSSSNLSIICAPHELVITLEDSENHTDTVT